MKKLVISMTAFVSLAGCISSLYGDGEAIGSVAGKPLYQASCTVDLSTAGQKGLFGSGTIPVYGTCETQASNRCGEGGYSIQSANRSNRRINTARIQNGPYVQTRRYPAEDVTLTFICKA